MAAMAMQVTLAQATVAPMAPNSALGRSVPESTRVAGAVQSRRAVQNVTAAAGVWRMRRNSRLATRAEAGGDAPTATATSTKASPASVGEIIEADKDTFWPIVKSAGEKVVVLDMYTQWCGPCKLMLPKIQALAATMDDVIFTKLDCNQENKPLAKELGIRVVPTFKIFKAGELVSTISGAKYDDLVRAIQSAREGQ